MRYTLVDAGFPAYKQIKQGRKVVGRVYKKADGMYGAVVGQGRHYSGATEQEAFRNAVVPELGFNSLEALQAHNSRMRHQRKVSKAKAQMALNELLAGNYEGFMDYMEGIR
jgi:hypothetical protein